jgi:hypothetical protein
MNINKTSKRKNEPSVSTAHSVIKKKKKSPEALIVTETNNELEEGEEVVHEDEENSLYEQSSHSNQLEEHSSKDPDLFQETPNLRDLDPTWLVVRFILMIRLTKGNSKPQVEIVFRSKRYAFRCRITSRLDLSTIAFSCLEYAIVFL